MLVCCMIDCCVSRGYLLNKIHLNHGISCLARVNSLAFFSPTSLSRAVGSPLLMDPNSICRKTKRLAGKQAELCQTEPEIVQEVAKGARLGVRECQYQFRFRRWNCTSHSKYFGKILQQGELHSFYEGDPAPPP